MTVCSIADECKYAFVIACSMIAGLSLGCLIIEFVWHYCSVAVGNLREFSTLDGFAVDPPFLLVGSATGRTRVQTVMIFLTIECMQ